MRSNVVKIHIENIEFYLFFDEVKNIYRYLFCIFCKFS